MVVTTPAELAESVASFLLDQGAPGLESDERDGVVRLTAHFAGAAPLAQLATYCDALLEFFPGAARPHVTVAEVPDAAWAESWKAHFPPLEIGRRLFVHPPWVTAVPAGRVGILLDPGMAFGTGHHASTRGCLRLLEAALQSQPGARVLDIGTGSGILAIAAAALGAREVWAVDIDADACAVAADNAAINGVAAAIHIDTALTAVSGAFDITVANLFAHNLIELADAIAARLLPGGLAIGSGILSDEAPAVAAAWQAAGLVAQRRDDEDGWATLSFVKPEPAQ